MRVEYTSVDPSLLSFAMKLDPSRNRGFTSGKSVELVTPAMYALPLASTAIEFEKSPNEQPRLVEYTIAEPAGFSFVMKTSSHGTLKRTTKHGPPGVYVSCNA